MSQSEVAAEERLAETAIIAVLGPGALTGFEIAAHLRASEPPLESDGLLYSTLHVLEADGRIEGFWSEEADGSRRKRYAIARRPPGHRAPAIFSNRWRRSIRGRA